MSSIFQLDCKRTKKGLRASTILIDLLEWTFIQSSEHEFSPERDMGLQFFLNFICLERFKGMGEIKVIQYVVKPGQYEDVLTGKK